MEGVGLVLLLRVDARRLVAVAAAAIAGTSAAVGEGCDTAGVLEYGWQLTRPSAPRHMRRATSTTLLLRLMFTSPARGSNQTSSSSQRVRSLLLALSATFTGKADAGPKVDSFRLPHTDLQASYINIYAPRSLAALSF